MALILHHYPFSPYAEKIRGILGYTNTPWISCLTSEAPPREHLEILSGGYRRIPVFQDGADIYCDSNLIADRLSQRCTLPELSAYGLSENDLQELSYFEEKLFFATVNLAFDFRFFKRLIKENSLFDVFKLVKDRIGMSRSSRISMGSPRTASKHVKKSIEMVTPRLEKQDFLGGDRPNIVDFGLYHCFWFALVPGQKNILREAPAVEAWFGRMHAFSINPGSSIDVMDALNIAQAAQPASIPHDQSTGDRIGDQVTIQPSDYRCDPVEGILVGETPIKWVIKRETPEVGSIHIHFPKRGYELV